MKETDEGEGAFEHLPVMYPLDVDQLHRRGVRATLNNRQLSVPSSYSNFRSRLIPNAKVHDPRSIFGISNIPTCRSANISDRMGISGNKCSNNCSQVPMFPNLSFPKFHFHAFIS